MQNLLIFLKYGQSIVEWTTNTLTDKVDSYIYRSSYMKYIFTYGHRYYCLGMRLLVVIYSVPPVCMPDVGSL